MIQTLMIKVQPSTLLSSLKLKITLENWFFIKINNLILFYYKRNILNRLNMKINISTFDKN